MKNFLIIFSIVVLCSQCVLAEIVEAPSASNNYSFSKKTYNMNSGSMIGNTYYAQNGTSYTRQENNIYGSDGSQYYDYGGLIQSSTGKTYQKNNNLIKEL